MRVEDLRYFEHLAEVLNYTRASKDLDFTANAFIGNQAP